VGEDGKDDDIPLDLIQQIFPVGFHLEKAGSQPQVVSRIRGGQKEVDPMAKLPKEMRQLLSALDENIANNIIMKLSHNVAGDEDQRDPCEANLQRLVSEGHCPANALDRVNHADQALKCLAEHKDKVDLKCEDQIRYSLNFLCHQEIAEQCHGDEVHALECLEKKKDMLSYECMDAVELSRDMLNRLNAKGQVEIKHYIHDHEADAAYYKDHDYAPDVFHTHETIKLPNNEGRMMGQVSHRYHFFHYVAFAFFIFIGVIILGLIVAPEAVALVAYNVLAYLLLDDEKKGSDQEGVEMKRPVEADVHPVHRPAQQNQDIGFDF
jgi:hypothetical protein